MHNKKLLLLLVMMTGCCCLGGGGGGAGCWMMVVWVGLALGCGAGGLLHRPYGNDDPMGLCGKKWDLPEGPPPLYKMELQ